VLLLIPAFVAFGIARPIATIAGAAGTIGASPPEARGLSSALATQARQLGAVFGVAVLGLVLTGIELSRRKQLLTGIDASFGHRRREALDGILAGSARAEQLLHVLSPVKQHAVRAAATTALVSGFRGAMLVTTLLAAAAAVASWLLLGQSARRRQRVAHGQ
jgi:hypothetical protein